MNMDTSSIIEYIVWFCLIAAAGFFVEIVWALGSWIRNRKKYANQCDLCSKIRVLRKTRDRAYWACRSCRKNYHMANKGNQ